MVIHKIGIVPMARFEDGVRAMIYKPKPKDGEADVAWGLARGTRMYYDVAANEWFDARDRVTAEANKDRLEAPIETAKREMGEELDVLEEECGGGLVDIGELSYDSQIKGAYPIHWFSGWVNNPERSRAPQDAVAVKWVSLDEVRAMADFKKSYLPVLEMIFTKMIAD